MFDSGQNSKRAHFSPTQRFVAGSAISVGSGLLFSVLIGDIGLSQYVIAQTNLILFELPFALLFAVLTRKFGWETTGVFSVLGTFSAFYLAPSFTSITPLLFLKLALMGIVLARYAWFGHSFFGRIVTVAFPGILLGFVLGLPIVLNGVSPEILSEMKQESYEIYSAFMSDDGAKNAAENAVYFFESIFKVGLAMNLLCAFILSWLALVLSGWVMVKFREEPDSIPAFTTFKVPFHAVWIFLVAGGIWLSGFEVTGSFSLNTLAVMGGLYGLQGLTIVIYHMNGISIGRLPKIIFWVIFFLAIKFSGVFLIVTGIIDNWFNLRSIKYETGDKTEGNKDESDSERRR